MTLRPRLPFPLAIALAMLAGAWATADEQLDYAPSDTSLRAVLIDSDPHESFLGMQTDTAGRLFVGGREALFIYEPDGRGGFHPRQELVRFPDHTWIYDIAIRGDDLYVLTVSALYVVPHAVTQRERLMPRRIVWGVPLGHVHQCFHGMAIGPEGDIYFAMGDPLWYYGDFNRPDHWGHWTFFSQPEGTRTPYTGVGGVFRCKPDGSDLRIVARGLRNSCGLCFDRHWNLFTNDNDHEGLPAQYVPGRLVHVTPHTYFNWPQGWLVSKTPDRADLLETMIDDLGRAVPVGQAYYDDEYLPEQYRNNLLVARWCIRALTNYPLERRGASFRVAEQTLLTGEDLARPVSVHVGCGGRVFFTVSYMAHNEGSPVYRGDVAMIVRRDDPLDQPYDGYEATTASAEKLFAELASPSWGNRYRAHVEIARRGGELLGEAAARLEKVADDSPAAEHLVWLAAMSRETRALRPVIELARHENAMLRLQAVRALTEFGIESPRAQRALRAALDDADPQIQHAAVLAQFDLPEPDLARMAESAGRSADSYLRQAAALLWAERASPSQIAELANSDDSALRLLAVLAAGFRLTLPPATAEIPPELPLEEPRGFEVPFAEGTIDLRTLGRVGNFTVAEHWKASRHTDEQEMLFALLVARLDDESEAVRLQAAHHLFLLNDDRSEPLVAKVRIETEDQRLTTAALSAANKMWTCGPFADGDAGFDAVHPPEHGAIELTAEYRDGERTIAWQEASFERLFDFGTLYGQTERSSSYAFFRLESGGRQRINLLVGSDDGIKVWHNGQLVFTNDVARAALPLQDVVVLELAPGSNDILLRVRNTTGESGLFAHYRALQPLSYVLPEKLELETLAERLRTASDGDQAAQLAQFLEVDWNEAARAGDAEQGRKLFESIGCAKCHAATAEANVTGGPSLADARRRFTVAYLVESVLLPSKQVSPVFRATGVITSDGQQLNGLVVGETAESIELLLPDAKRVMIAKSDIEERQTLDLSPMPQGVVKKPEELRDLLAYLLGG